MLVRVIRQRDNAEMIPTVDDRLLVFVENMPAFPKSVQGILRLADDSQSAAKDFVQIIERDPVMTVKVLRIINSPYYGLPQKISSIPRAVVHLGINTIKNMALAIAAIGMFSPRNRSGFNVDSFLLHSLSTALIVKRLAERLQLPSCECSDYFVAGLLHDFGKLVFAECLPEAFNRALIDSNSRQVPLQAAERNYLGIDHAQLGKMLAEKWRFAESVIDAIEHHHDAYGDNPMRDSVAAANQISKWMRLGDGGNPVIEAASEAAIALFGSATLEDLAVSLGDLSPVRSEAMAMIER